MKAKRTLAWGLLIALMAAQPAYAIETAAKQAFLIDATTRTALFEKDADVPMHPSSMSKLMTLYALFSRLKEGRIKLTDKLPISEKAWRTQGSKTFVHVGDEISVEDLIHGIIIQSGNDACIVVAEGLSGSEEAFVKELNRIAKEIGMENSHFTNATGLPEDEHLMTARDLATLAERLIEDFPEYYHYFSIREYTYSGIKQQNRNRLLGASIGVDGLKTGHTEAAGYGISLSAKQGNRRLILIINGLGSDNARVEEGDKLLRYGFREFENKTLVKKGQKIADAEVWFGTKPTVSLVAKDDLSVTVPAGAAKSASFTLKYNTPLPAPVTKDTPVATLSIRISPDAKPMQVDVLAGEDVGAVSGFKRMWLTLNHLIAAQ